MKEELRPLLKKFLVFAKNNLTFKKPPKLFLRQDTANQKSIFGKTAHYDPHQSSITLYVSGRHPKDIMRSFAHELVHHCQNERGDLSPEKMKSMTNNYAQECPHMRKMEKEAYLLGNMCFRDWEDSMDDKLQYKMQIAEQKFLKENKNMSVKIKRKDLKNLITKLLEKKIRNKNIKEGCGGAYYRDDGAAAGDGECSNPDCVDGSCEECKSREKISEQHDNDGDGEFDGLGPGHYFDTRESEEQAKYDACIEAAAADPAGKAACEEAFPAKKPAPGPTNAAAAGLGTPESEADLYESRFTNRNTRLFQKLLKEWTR